MPPKQDPYATRAIKILRLYRNLLFKGDKQYLVDLERSLQCSKQTVGEMIEQIGQIHELDQGKDGKRKWYRLRSPPVRPKATLSPRAVQGLRLCLDVAGHLLPEDTREEVKETITSATVLLENFEDRAQATMPLATGLPRGAVDYTPFSAILTRLTHAIAKRQICRVQYQASYRNQPKEYYVAPLKLLAHGDALYLQARLADNAGEPKANYDDMRLAVHRLHEVRVTKKHFDLSTPEEEPRTFGLIDGEPFRVRVRFIDWAELYVRERVWSADQVFEDSPAGTVLEFTATSWPETISWILSFGPNAEVLEPRELRTRVAKELRSACVLYPK